MTLVASDLEWAIFEAQNRIRVQPGSYVPVLTEEIKRFTNFTMIKLNGVDMETQEGKAAWEEAAFELKTQKPLSMLEWSDGLALAAQDHCEDAARN